MMRKALPRCPSSAPGPERNDTQKHLQPAKHGKRLAHQTVQEQDDGTYPCLSSPLEVQPEVCAQAALQEEDGDQERADGPVR